MVTKMVNCISISKQAECSQAGLASESLHAPWSVWQSAPQIGMEPNLTSKKTMATIVYLGKHLLGALSMALAAQMSELWLCTLW